MEDGAASGVGEGFFIASQQFPKGFYADHQLPGRSTNILFE
jgi:hypothetical protein